MSSLGRPLALGLLTVALANLLFLVLMVAAQGDRDVIAERVRAAFDTGELVAEDYLFFDARRGWHQYNDCNVLQMLTNEDPSRLRRALAPKTFFGNEDGGDQCAVLRALVVEGVDPQTLLLNRYARYWHGYAAVAAFGLRVMDLRDLRRVLSGAVWLSIALLALATRWSGPRTRRAGLIIALTAATVWAVPYFAPGFTHGPGDALVLLGLTAIVVRPRMTMRLDTIVPFAAAFGATVVFFEMLTAQLPVVIAWLVAVVLAVARDEGRPAPTLVLAAVTAFGVGAVATVITKQILAVSLADPLAGAFFVARLGEYMSSPGILRPFAELVQSSFMLTFGNTLLGHGLVAAAGLAWLAAAIRGWRERSTEHGRDRLILVGAALIPVAWVLVLPNHTAVHALFMVRMLVVPVSLAPLALCWPR